MGRFGRLLSLFAVACALAGAYNVFVPDPHLEAVARLETCQGNRSTCRSRLLRLRRSPFTQAYVFAAGGVEIEVDCTRAFLLVGGYRCTPQPRVKLHAPGRGDTHK